MTCLPAASLRLRRHSRRKSRLAKPVTLVVLAALACTADTTLAAPPQPMDLQVAGGTDAWHADNRFSLRWEVPTPNGAALRATLYRLRDPEGRAIGAGRLAWIADTISPLTVPEVPGAYGAEVWFEDTAGEQGPAAMTRLRFDDTRPSPVEPGPMPAWIGRSTFPLRVPLRHPAGPLPLSGIRGYAVAIDSMPLGSPCAATDRCTDAETDLRGGIDDDELEIAALPEGASYLHAVAVSGSGMRSAIVGHAVLRVDLTDPVTRLAGAPSGWTNRPVSLTAHATDAGSGMQAAGSGPAPFAAIRVDGGAPVIGIGDSTATRVIEEGIHRIAYYARDAAGNVDDGAQSNGIANRPPRVATVRIDRTPPVLAFANAQDPREPDLVRVRIADPLSGPDSVRAWIGVRLTGSSDRFDPLPQLPPAAGELRARWDSDAYPPGEYEFLARGYDAAGNAASTTRRANGMPMVLSNPLKASTALLAGFGGRDAERSVPYGHGVRLAGRLTTGIRSPLAGMPVRIVERFAPGPGPAVRASTVRTGPDGAWSLRLPPGPSREVEAIFPGSATLSRSTGGPLRLRVRGAGRLSASSAVARVGGPPLVFRGRVLPTEAIPAGGKAVQLQFRLAGRAWSEFRTVQTDRRGRFRYAYRFSDDDSRGVRFQFRAYAPAQENWPYEPAGSRPVIVRGR
jgi:hypothetical protein